MPWRGVPGCFPHVTPGPCLRPAVPTAQPGSLQSPRPHSSPHLPFAHSSPWHGLPCPTHGCRDAICPSRQTSGPSSPQQRYCPFSEFPSDSEPAFTRFRDGDRLGSSGLRGEGRAAARCRQQAELSTGVLRRTPPAQAGGLWVLSSRCPRPRQLAACSHALQGVVRGT